MSHQNGVSIGQFYYLQQKSFADYFSVTERVNRMIKIPYTYLLAANPKTTGESLSEYTFLFFFLFYQEISHSPARCWLVNSLTNERSLWQLASFTVLSYFGNTILILRNGNKYSDRHQSSFKWKVHCKAVLFLIFRYF